MSARPCLERPAPDHEEKALTLLLPITLTTASVLALLGMVISIRAALTRGKTGILIGDGGNHELIVRMRTHANFVEYVPLLLVFMGLLELAGVSRTLLMASAGLLVIARVLHAVGMAGKQPNLLRAAGTVGTTVVMAVYIVCGLMQVFAH